MGPELVYLLRNLSATGDVLVVGAHPDDEDNGVMAWLAHHHGVRVVYWSATRGEAGQSRIHSYTGEELGIYRTWESAAAREIDGGESLFGPFTDYGYSKHGAEALEKWDATRLVGELVRAIRVVQPQVVISLWRGDESAGHGHHAAVGTAIKEAFETAGDPRAFPEFERIGLVPWRPRKLYQSIKVDWQPGEKVELGVHRPDLKRDGCLEVNTGRFDPIRGLTYEEQGALARNAHLTQGFAHVPTAGDFYNYLELVQVVSGGDSAASAIDLYAGIDATLTGLADYPGGGSIELRSELDALKQLAVSAAEDFRPAEPWRSGRRLLEFVRMLRHLEGRLDRLGLSEHGQRALARYLTRKRSDAEGAAARCLGLRLDAALNRGRLTPGESVRVACRLQSYGPDVPSAIDFHPRVALAAAEALRIDDASDASAAEFEIAIPSAAPLSCPYWLRANREEYSYTWPEVPFAGQPFNPPLVEVTCEVRFGEMALQLTRAAAHAQAFAGGYRELQPAILPPISMQPRKSRHVLRVRDTPQVLDLQVAVLGHHLMPPIAGVLEVHVPPGWSAEPSRLDVSLQKAGDADSIPVRITVPAHAAPGAHEIRYGISCSGRLYDASMTTVRQTAPGLGGAPDEATCIREQYIARPAVVRVDLMHVSVYEEQTCAYVAGTGDDVPTLLRSLGLTLEVLSDEDLAHAALERYDSIVIGPNAYVVRDAVRKAGQRLLAYVHGGGTLVVQYQGYPYERMGATPYPFRYNQPHDRITNQHSTVRLIAPDHFLLRYPNVIGADDFSGWVRDRGMYFFGEWDKAYEPLLASADPGEQQKLGGLLVARWGKGVYAYCGYTLFRQLPAGVRGAFRLFANLVAIPEARIRQRMDHLRGVPLFAGLSEHELHRVAEIIVDRWLSDGEYLFREGDEGEELYLIAAGALDVWKGQPEQLVGSMVSGMPIGELSAFTGFTRAASLKARGPTHLLAVHSNDFRRLLRESPELGERMMELLARRLRTALASPPGPGNAVPAVAKYE